MNQESRTIDTDFTQSMDATVWAAAFVEHARKDPTFATDEGNMIGWFANAIMRGYDEHARRAEAGSGREAIRQEIIAEDAEDRARGDVLAPLTDAVLEAETDRRLAATVPLSPSVKEQLPAGMTTRWLAALADAKQNSRKDGTANPYGDMTSVEAIVWWWEHVEKPRAVTDPNVAPQPHPVGGSMAHGEQKLPTPDEIDGLIRAAASQWIMWEQQFHSTHPDAEKVASLCSTSGNDIRKQIVAVYRAALSASQLTTADQRGEETVEQSVEGVVARDTYRELVGEEGSLWVYLRRPLPLSVRVRVAAIAEDRR